MTLGSAIDKTLAALPIRTASTTISTTACVLAALGAGWIAVWPESWLVEHVVFEGMQRADQRALRHLADLQNGTTVWQVDTERIARSVERHPWVRSASVEILWPATVSITVAEHTPAAILHDSGQLIYVNSYGEPFLHVRPDDLDYPHLIDFEPMLSRLHPDLGTLAIRDALWLIDALDTRALIDRTRVSTVSFSRTSGLTLEAGPVRLLFGLHDLPGQLDRLALLVAQGTRLDQPLQIDLAPSSVAIVHTLPTRIPTPTGPTPAGG